MWLQFTWPSICRYLIFFDFTFFLSLVFGGGHEHLNCIPPSKPNEKRKTPNHWTLLVCVWMNCVRWKSLCLHLLIALFGSCIDWTLVKGHFCSVCRWFSSSPKRVIYLRVQQRLLVEQHNFSINVLIYQIITTNKFWNVILNNDSQMWVCWGKHYGRTQCMSKKSLLLFAKIDRFSIEIVQRECLNKRKLKSERERETEKNAHGKRDVPMNNVAFDIF